MPAIPLPDAQTQDYLDQARAQAVAGLKGQFPDSMLAPPTSGGSFSAVGVGVPPQSTAPPVASDPDATAEPADVEGPAPTAEPAAPAQQAPSTFQGFWSTLGNRLASGALEGVQGIERLAVGATSPLMTQQFSDSLFKTIDDTWNPAIQALKQRQQSAVQAGNVGRGAQFLGGIAEGAAPLVMGPEAFLASSTMQSGTDTLDQGGDLRAAYTLAGVNLVANAAGMKVPFKSPAVIKRVLLNSGYGAGVSAASQYLAKEVLKGLGENGLADQINPLDPTSTGTSALISGIFGALEKPRVAAKFRELGGAVPGDPGPGAVPATAAPKTVASVRPTVAAAPGAPVTVAPAVERGFQVPTPPTASVVADTPSAEPLPDLQAQIADMHDPETPRKAVYLAPDNVEQLGPEGVAELAKGAKQIRNFDKKGGVLIVPDVAAARAARDLRTAEPDMQKVLGQLTGAGDGKQVTDTAVVQGQTPAGAVATETAVRPEEVPQAVAAAQEQGKTPVVTTPEAAVARREALVGPSPTAEAAYTGPLGSPESDALELATIRTGAGDRAVEVMGDAPGGRKRVRVLDPTGEPGAEITVPAEALNAKAAAGAPEPTIQRPKTAIGQLPYALSQLEKQETSAPGKVFPARLGERQQNAASFAAALKAAAAESRGKAPDEAVERALAAARTASTLAEKSPEATAKGQGTSHTRTTAVIDEMKKAARVLMGAPQSGDEVRVAPKAAEFKARLERKAAREARVAEEAGEMPRGQPENPEVITVNPRAIRGREIQALTEELGYDPTEIAAEAEKATGTRKGALTGFLQEIAGGLDPNKGWLAHVSALNPARTKESPLNRSQHIQLGNLVSRFARVDAEAAPHLRDAIDNFMNNIGGRRLDDRTQAAVHEYAAARRRMEVLKDRIAEETDEGPGESVYVENEESPAREGYFPEELEELRSYPAEVYADKLWGTVAKKLDDAGFSRYLGTLRDAGSPARLHELLDFARDATDNPMARSIIAAVRRYVIDTPVHFVDQVTRPSGEPLGPNSVGLHTVGPGVNHIQIALGREAHPIRILLHEAVHAATTAFIRMNPEHEFTQEIERLRQIALERAERMMGRKLADGDLRDYLYGLKSAKEFMAEALSNDRFMRFLVESDKYAGPADRLVRIVHRLADAIRGLFGIHRGPEAKLFDNVLHATGQVMREQSLMNDRLERLFYPEGPEATQAIHSALETDPPRMRNEERIMADKPEAMRPLLRSFSHVTKSRTWDALSRSVLYMQQLDWLVRRHARFFGTDSADNPLRRWQSIREQRSAVQNKLAAHVTPAGESWMRLTPAQNKRLGQFMIDSTVWGIDPTVAKADHSAKTQALRGFSARYDDFQRRWGNLSEAERQVYTAVRDANRWLTKQSRRAAIDAVVRAYGDEMTPVQKELLYNVKRPEEYDALIGDGKQIDLPGINEKVLDALKDMAGLHEMEGPYFHLGRDGEHVVQVKPEGASEFGTQDEARAFAERVRDLGPSSTAKVTQLDGKWSVDYKAQYVSMHRSPAEAEADAARMRAQGFEVGPVTRKVFSERNAPLTYGMRELVAEAKRQIESHGADDGTEAATQSLTAAFVNLLAARSAYAGSKLARKGVAGVKPEEMRMAFARHATALAWHTANLRTVFDEADAMGRVREAARNPEIGNATQGTMYVRGRVVSELNRRLQDEVQNYGVKTPFSTVMSKLNYLNFLLSPAHAGIWLTQNVSVGLPVMGARYGYGRTSAALLRSGAFLPALRATMKGLLRVPGNVTNTDVTKAVLEALARNPKLERWTRGENSPLQQLMDRGAISSSLSNELASVAQGDNQLAARTMEWARLLPHMADLYNRVSTAIAGLELTGGDVHKTADLIREIHVDYSSGNQSGLFKTVKRIPLIGPSAAALKTYVQGMTHLMLATIHDVITGEGEGGRAEAAKVLAGLYVGSAVFAGMVGSTPFPARLIAYGYNKLFGDGDEYYDLDNSIRRWCSEVFGEDAGRIIASGVPRALGFDLSHRMGLSDLPFYDPPDLLGPQPYSDKFKDLVYTMAGTLPQMVGGNLDSFTNHMRRGEPAQALLSFVPVKALRDAQKAYDESVHGLRTRAGGTVLGPGKFGTTDKVFQALGFKPAKVADAQERKSTVYDYRQWAQGRKQQLLAQWATATDKAPVMSQISQWNAKNPGIRITRSDMLKMMRSAQRAGQIGAGAPQRDPTMRRLLSY